MNTAALSLISEMLTSMVIHLPIQTRMRMLIASSAECTEQQIDYRNSVLTVTSVRSGLTTKSQEMTYLWWKRNEVFKNAVTRKVLRKSQQLSERKTCIKYRYLKSNSTLLRSTTGTEAVLSWETCTWKQSFCRTKLWWYCRGDQYVHFHCVVDFHCSCVGKPPFVDGASRAWDRLVKTCLRGDFVICSPTECWR